MLRKYKNGNALITISEDGTREIEFSGKLELDFPLNLDIRVSTTCSFADNICKGFCHERAVRKGFNCDFIALQEILSPLPKGIELAIGSNEMTEDLMAFVNWCNQRDYICNITANQGHLIRDFNNLSKVLFEDNSVKGLGISYREKLKWNIPKTLLDYPNTVFHVIAGIDRIENILSLKDKGVRKVLVLGEKDFGYNEGKVNLKSQNHKEWFWWIGKLFDTFEVVSFDNLALEQLNIKRFFTNNDWNTFNQGEHSFYINAVEQYFSPSSRSNYKRGWNKLSIRDYFKLKQQIYGI